MASEREDQAVEHKETRTEISYLISAELRITEKWISECSCGARWSHQAKSSQEEMDSIFKSHVKYFENRTLIL